MLELRNIYLSFEMDLIIDGNIKVQDGEITVISGKSGSGKSSLLYDIAFLTNQSKMQYMFNDYDVNDLTKKQKDDLQRNSIAFVFQNIQLIDSMTLMGNIEFFAYLTQDKFDVNRAREYLTDFNLYLDDNTDVSTLSGGEKQRLAIVCALMKETSLIILDEPTAYLDYDNQLKLLDVFILLKEKYHKTILIASHNDLIKDICDHLYEIDNQKIIERKRKFYPDENNRLQIKKTSYQNALKLFYHKLMKASQWKNGLIIFLMTIIFSFSSFVFVFFNIYQNQIHSTIQDIQSQQIVFETSLPLDNEEIKKIEYIENIKDIKRCYPLETDNNYLICPYVDSDYFGHFLTNRPNQNGVYGNYEVYRKNKDIVVNCIISNQSYEFSIQNYLNQSFEDYRGLSSQSQVIYVPYFQYEEIMKAHNKSLKSSTMFIMQITDKAYYLNTIEKVMKDYPNFQIQGNSNLLKLIEVQSQLNVFNQSSLIFVFGFLIIIVTILKVLEHYHWRKNNVVLEINGINRKDIIYTLIRKEFVLFFSSLILSIVIVYSIYIILGLISLGVIFQVFICLLIETVFLFISSFIIYIIVEKLLPVIRIIKEK